MTINEEILTKLHYKDVVMLSAMYEAYKNSLNKDDLKSEPCERARKLVDRLGAEIYSHPKNDFTK